jgi:hypothetical protein
MEHMADTPTPERFSVIYAHGLGGFQADWVLAVDMSGTIYDSGFKLDDSDLRRQLSLERGRAAQIPVRLLIEQEETTSISTVSGAIARIIRAADETLKEGHCMTVYVYSIRLTKELKEPGYVGEAPVGCAQ